MQPDEESNPFKVHSKEYEEFKHYYRPLSAANNTIIVNHRLVLNQLADIMTGDISPLAKILIRQQIVQLCIALAYPLFVRAEVFSIVSTGIFNTPNEIKENYLKSKMYVYEQKLVSFLSDLRTKRFVQKGPRHKTTFKSSRIKPAKSNLSLSSKTSLNQSVTFKDSTLDPAEKTLASSPVVTKSLEDIYKELHLQPTTVYDIMDIFADFSCARP